MNRYKEIEYDIIEAIKNSPDKGLHFMDIMKACPDALRAHKILRKFISRNHLTELNGPNGAYFCIREANVPMNIRRVMCPACKTVRRTFRDDQIAIHCANKDCKTPSGRHRTFWLVNIDHLKRGEVKRINCVN